MDRRLLGAMNGVSEPGGKSRAIFAEPLGFQVPVDERF
jgi:hypothetical protein